MGPGPILGSGSAVQDKSAVESALIGGAAIARQRAPVSPGEKPSAGARRPPAASAREFDIPGFGSPLSVATPGSRVRGRSNGIGCARMVGRADCMVKLSSGIEVLAKRNCTVLIRGESGTGKELAARHLHAASPRAAGPFVTVDCTTLRDTLFESQLFGHVKGAFTGADQATLGLFRAADGGTLFLDEIGELQFDIQAKLLRCIQEGAVVPLGSIEPVPVDVRIIAATHRDLKEMVRLGRFREDLYYRLDVVRLDVPPLRERREDIISLAKHFLQELADTYAEPVKALSPDARAALESYDWPGNVRELQNVIEHAVTFLEGVCLTAAELPGALRRAATRRGSNGHPKSDERSNIVTLQAAERCLIKRALRATQGNQTLSAELLGVERHRLARMIRRHGLRGLVGAKST